MERACDMFARSPAVGGSDEVLLPDVVLDLVRSGTRFRVLSSDDPCIGVTYPEDTAAVRAVLREAPPW
jgi:hypothetical protein